MNASIPPRRVVVLGSTGSIGCQTLAVIAGFAPRWQVVGLAAGKNVPLLVEQAERFRPQAVWFEGAESAGWTGPGRLEPPDEMVVRPDVDTVVVATSGRAGLVPTLRALEAGKIVALATKEVLVIGGRMVADAVRAGRGEVRPVDSEHNALWQCLDGEADGIPVPDWGSPLVPGRFSPGRVARLILTASGGPFRDWPLDRLHEVRPEHALQHPTWRMGRKVTIDSATLMNKGLEVVEAHWLFGAPWDRIDVLLHPESLVHALVEFTDGCIKAQLAPTDMRLPIQYALSYPWRLPNADLPRLDLAAVRSLTFCRPDPDRYPCFELAVQAGRLGGTYPVVLAAADEAAVDLFCEGRIRFTEIPGLIRQALETHTPRPDPSLADILELYDETQTRVRGAVQCRHC